MPSGCFVDIFGSKRDKECEKPLPRETLEMCIEACKQYEAKRYNYTTIPPPTKAVPSTIRLRESQNNNYGLAPPPYSVSSTLQPPPYSQ
uniref:Uncharacterized protein n=1 Tax=Rhabditophanes sp. KR3021 TaxID=114890 RepID=A0AC35UAT2_9BILA